MVNILFFEKISRNIWITNKILSWYFNKNRKELLDMNILDDMKLAIYESNIDETKKNALVTILESSMDEEVMMEAARFTVIPTFKKMSDKYPELKGYQSLINEAESIIILSGGKVDNNIARSVLKFFVKLIKIFASIESVILAPSCILIFPIVYYLIERLWVFAGEWIEFKIVEDELNGAVDQLRRVQRKTEDEKTKEKIEEAINKINEKIIALRVREEKEKN